VILPIAADVYDKKGVFKIRPSKGAKIRDYYLCHMFDPEQSWVWINAFSHCGATILSSSDAVIVRESPPNLRIDNKPRSASNSAVPIREVTQVSSVASPRDYPPTSPNINQSHINPPFNNPSINPAFNNVDPYNKRYSVRLADLDKSNSKQPQKLNPYKPASQQPAYYNNGANGAQPKNINYTNVNAVPYNTNTSYNAVSNATPYRAVSPPIRPSYERPMSPVVNNRPTSPVVNGLSNSQTNVVRAVNQPPPDKPRSKGPPNNNVIPDFMSSNSTSGYAPPSQRGTDYSNRGTNQSPADILRESKGKAVTPTDYDSRSTGNIVKPVFL